MTTWNGKLTFGMVNFDVAMEKTVRDQSISFKQFDKEDKSPIKRIAVRESDGKKVTQEDIVKGLVCEDGNTVIFTNEEVVALKGPLEHAIEVLDFIPKSKVPLWSITNLYHLLPRGSGKNIYPAYRLFVKSCTDNDCVAIVKFVLRTKQYTGVIYCDGVVGKEYLMLGMLPYADEVVEVKEKLEGYFQAVETMVLDEKMVKMSNELIKMHLVDEFNHEKYQDEFRDKIVKEADRKRKTRGKKRSDNVVSITSRRKVTTKPGIKGKTG